jgi:membrane AbrB-like protein
VDQFVPTTRSVIYGRLALLILLTGACALYLKQMELPNAWVLGPMLMAATLTALVIHLSALPEWMICFGQLSLGASLGTRFIPQFLHTAPRYPSSVALCAVTAILAAGGFGMAFAHFSGIDPAASILATASGNMAQMSLTAKTLQLGIPVVAAFHVAHMLIIVAMIGPLSNLTGYLHLRIRSAGARRLLAARCRQHEFNHRRYGLMRQSS